MPTLNLNTVELVSTVIEAPQNGSASSDDYNDTVKGILADLSALASAINTELLTLVNALPDSALLPSSAPVGLEGRTMYSDSSDTTGLFFDSLNNTPLTVADSLRSLSSMLTTFQTQLTDMGVQVAAVQTQLASDNRNDIASALQNLVNSLASANATITTNTANIASHETRLQRFKSKRVTTGAVNAGDNVIIAVTWATPFVDNNYTVTLGMEDNAGDLRVLSFSYLANGAGLEVQVNNSGAAAATGNIHVMAHYDPEVA